MGFGLFVKSLLHVSSVKMATSLEHRTKKIVRRSWTVIPTPDIVVARVSTLGNDQPQQLIFVIGDMEIPGVDDDDKMEDNFAGVPHDSNLV